MTKEEDSPARGRPLLIKLSSTELESGRPTEAARISGGGKIDYKAVLTRYFG